MLRGRIGAVLLSAVLLTQPGCFEIISKPVPEGPPPIPEVSNVLLELVNKQDTFEVSSGDYESTSLKYVNDLKTPIGLRIALRYRELSIPLVEALKLSRNRGMISRLFEVTKWSTKQRVRAEALVTLGSFSDPADVGYFVDAMADKDLGIRCAAIEALQAWGLPAANDLLKSMMNDPWSPVAQLLAARALCVLGDESGLPVILKMMEDRSWVIRAMAVRYAGDFAHPDDYTKTLAVFNSESRNDFVIAEAAIATLKLVSRKSKDMSYVAGSKKWNDSEDVKYWYGTDSIVEVEPLIIQPPRLYVKGFEQVTQTLNTKLISLIKNRLDAKLSAEDDQDSNHYNLSKLVTPMGLALQTRYDNLTLIVAEGLGGSNDGLLRIELSNLADNSKSAFTRATACLALGFNRNDQDLPVILRALESSDPIVRFGGMEAILAGRFENAMPEIFNIATNDPIPAFKIFAIQILTKFNNPSARNFLLASLNEQDWPARAMAAWYLGRYGQEDDYTAVLSRIGAEQNPFVKAEMALAIERLAPVTK